MQSEQSLPNGSNVFTSDSIHIALSSDNNYFEGLLVTTWTIAKNCSRPNQLCFHILDGGINENNFDFLRKALDSFRCKIDRITVNQKTDLTGLGTWHGNSRMAYARLLLPNILKEADHVIYSDVDFVWIGDVARLWELRDQNQLLGYVHRTAKGFEICKAEHDWAKQFHITLDNGQYFCTGMLLMNLRKFRDERVSEKMFDLLKRGGGAAPFADQTVLNMFMTTRTDKTVLPNNWQVCTCDPDSCIVTPNIVIHYAGDTPWKSIHEIHHFLTDFHIIWHNIHGRLRGISTWNSLRQYNSISGIVFGRLLYLGASRIAPVRWLLRLYLILIGRRDSVNFIEAFMRKTVIKDDALAFVRG